MHPKTIEARVTRITPLTDRILQIILKPDEYVDYEAGQYLQMMDNNEAFSYSIANAPLGSHQYELHIRHTQANPYHQPLLAKIKRTGRVMLHLPLGTCTLSRLHPKKPILFIAGGTGFAPIHAMIEQLLADGDARVFDLCWGARSQSDLYLEDKVKCWAEKVPHFTYASLVSGSGHMTLSELILQRHEHDLDTFQVVMGGPFDMVYSLRDMLLLQGLSQDHLFSDAF
jgi:CDP-4-dehydro-6-deoxyglucose reductase